MRKARFSVIAWAILLLTLPLNAKAEDLPELTLNSVIPTMSTNINEIVKFALPASIKLNSQSQLKWDVVGARYSGNTKEEVFVPTINGSEQPRNSTVFGWKVDKLGRDATLTFTVRLAGKYSIDVEAANCTDAYSCKRIAKKTIELNFIAGGDSSDQIYPLPADIDSPQLILETSDPGNDSFGVVKVKVIHGLYETTNYYFITLVTNGKSDNLRCDHSENEMTCNITSAEYYRDKLEVSLTYSQDIPGMSNWTTDASIKREIKVPIVMNFKSGVVNDPASWEIFDAFNKQVTDFNVVLSSYDNRFLSPYVDLQFATDVKSFPVTANCLIIATRIEAKTGSKWASVSNPVYTGDSCSVAGNFPEERLRTPYLHEIHIKFNTLTGKANYRIVQGITYGLDKFKALSNQGKNPEIIFNKVLGSFNLIGPQPYKPSPVVSAKTPNSSSKSPRTINSQPNSVTIPNYVGMTVNWVKTHPNAYPGIHPMITTLSSCSISDLLSGDAIVIAQNPSPMQKRKPNVIVQLKTNC